MRIRNAVSWTAQLALALAITGVPGFVHAQARAEARSERAGAAHLSVLVFRTASSDQELKRLATTLDSLLIAEVARREQHVAQHALELPATQLALDCVAETPACLGAVARQADAAGLLASKLERSGAEVVLSVLYFPARPGAELRYATRRAQSARAPGRLLDAVPALVDELLGGPRPATAAKRARPARASRKAAAKSAPTPAVARSAGARTSRVHFPLLPVALTGAGVAFLGAGVAFGLSAQGYEDEHAEARTGSDADVDEALATFDRARTHATLSTVGFAVGGAALAVGTGLWLFAPERDENAPHARLAPRITRKGASLVLQGRFAEPAP